jgi:thioredoxin reductase (NADPH)
MNDKKNYTLIIIGAGPIGLACGIEAEKKNVDYLILEKGCLVNSIYHYPVDMQFFSTSDKIEIGNVPFVSHDRKPTRREALEYYRRVKEHWGLNVKTYERVEGIEQMSKLADEQISETLTAKPETPNSNPKAFKVISEKAVYTADYVIVATGFYDQANMLGVPGEDLAKVKHFYDEPHPYLDQKVLVVGAANSAIDVALETWRKGSEVTLVHRGPEVGSRVKYWVRPDIDNRIKEGSIKAYFNSQVIEIRDKEVDLQTPQGKVTLENDFVLAMTGYHPDFSWLERLGIQLSDDDLKIPVRDPDTFETPIPNLYIAGTVCGGMQTNKWFIENSIEHAEVILQDIAKK